MADTLSAQKSGQMFGCKVFLLPGWQNSDSAHWQSLWEANYGYERVQQYDWLHPRSGDWQVQLEEAVLQQDRPVVLVAHSLGCQLVSRWSVFSQNTNKVLTVMLVAPSDTETLKNRHLLPSWQPILRTHMPFASTVVVSSNDPFAELERTRQMANDWGSACVNAGAIGHINSASGVGAWPQGHAWLEQLVMNAVEQRSKEA